MDCINQIVRSLVGHDAGALYLVLNVQGNKAYLADGRLKTVARPKIKNLKHIELMTYEPDATSSIYSIYKEEKERLSSTSDVRDEDIRRVIKLYKKSHGI